MQMLLPPRVDPPGPRTPPRRTPTRAFSGESGGSWTWVVLTWVALGVLLAPVALFLGAGVGQPMDPGVFFVAGVAALAAPAFAVVGVLRAAPGWNRHVAIGTLVAVVLLYLPGLLR